MARKIYSVTCVVCKKTVEKTNKQKTCGMACREVMKHWARVRGAEWSECPVCRVTAPLYLRVRDVQVCSKRCKYVLCARFYRERDDWDYAKYQKLHEKPVDPICRNCGKTFVPRRYDQKFCCVKCCENWHHHFGKKGDARRRQVEEERERRNTEIGYCELCGTAQERIVPACELGVRGYPARAKFHRDHIDPKCNGGADEDDNRRWLCWFCNTARQDMDPAFDAAIAAAGRAFWAAMLPVYSSMTS